MCGGGRGRTTTSGNVSGAVTTCGGAATRPPSSARTHSPRRGEVHVDKGHKRRCGAEEHLWQANGHHDAVPCCLYSQRRTVRRDPWRSCISRNNETRYDTLVETSCVRQRGGTRVHTPYACQRMSCLLLTRGVHCMYRSVLCIAVAAAVGVWTTGVCTPHREGCVRERCGARRLTVALPFMR